MQIFLLQIQITNFNIEMISVFDGPKQINSRLVNLIISNIYKIWIFNHLLIEVSIPLVNLGLLTIDKT